MFRESRPRILPAVVSVCDVLSRRDENREATRQAVFAAGRRLFVERGYADASIDEIVQTARVTKGALYYHFKDKKDLFRAIVEDVTAELTNVIAARVRGRDDAWECVVKGTDAFLDFCLDPAYQRIVVREGPAVLGSEDWRALAERHGLGIIRMMCEMAMKQGVIQRQPIDPLAHLLHGALHEGALYIALADDPKKARRQVGTALLRLLDGLRKKT